MARYADLLDLLRLGTVATEARRRLGVTWGRLRRMFHCRSLQRELELDAELNAAAERSRASALRLEWMEAVGGLLKHPDPQVVLQAAAIVAGGGMGVSPMRPMGVSPMAGGRADAGGGSPVSGDVSAGAATAEVAPAVTASGEERPAAAGRAKAAPPRRRTSNAPPPPWRVDEKGRPAALTVEEMGELTDEQRHEWFLQREKCHAMTSKDYNVIQDFYFRRNRERLEQQQREAPGGTDAGAC